MRDTKSLANTIQTDTFDLKAEFKVLTATDVNELSQIIRMYTSIASAPVTTFRVNAQHLRAGKSLTLGRGRARGSQVVVGQEAIDELGKLQSTAEESLDRLIFGEYTLPESSDGATDTDVEKVTELRGRLSKQRDQITELGSLTADIGWYRESLAADPSEV